MSKILFILCDGINNSVFSNLVLTPLLTMLNNDETTRATLISFERPLKSPEDIHARIPSHPRLTFVQHLRFPFWGISSLWYQAHVLKKHLVRHHYDRIICRGSLAGYLALLARKDVTIPITIQARGLAAEEYRLACGATTARDLSLKPRLIYHRLHRVEHRVYGTTHPNVTIETVSTALKTYLQQTFWCTRPITIATGDLPTALTPTEKQRWKDTIRTKLTIPHDAYVYCYAGSARPWQCGEETIQYLARKLAENPSSYAVVLTTQPEEFTSYITRHGLDTTRLILTCVPPHKTLYYLAAADEGILLRKPDVINWVSRPTKVLEYACAHLVIAHNNTVGYVSELKNSRQHIVELK